GEGRARLVSLPRRVPSGQRPGHAQYPARAAPSEPGRHPLRCVVLRHQGPDFVATVLVREQGELPSRPTRHRIGHVRTHVRTIVLALLLSACARVGAVPLQPVARELPAATERPFRMGFTTERGGPAGGQKSAPAPTLRFIRANGDIVTVHRDGPPVPWR